jgi:hypothetical protein
MMARRKRTTPVFTREVVAQIEAAPRVDAPIEAELKAEEARLNDGTHCAYGGYHDTARDREIWNNFCSKRSSTYHH